MTATAISLDELPATPQVLLEVLELCQRGEVSHQQIASTILLDPVLASRLLSLTSDQLNYRDRENSLIVQAVQHLGLPAVQSVAIEAARRLCRLSLDASRQDYYGQLWYRMILAAKLGSAYAILTQYPNPGEAYMAGLLQELGRLRVLSVPDIDDNVLDIAADEAGVIASERNLFGEDHCQWGHRMVKAWHLPGFLADAVRYQHYSADQVADAHHLVRLSSLTSHLASPNKDTVRAGLEMGQQLYGVNPSLSEEILAQARAETERSAEELKVKGGDGESIRQQLAALEAFIDDLLQIQTISSSLAEETITPVTFQSAFTRVIKQSLGCKEFVILQHDAEQQRLIGSAEQPDNFDLKAGDADWQIALAPERSLLAKAFNTEVAQVMGADDDGLSVADTQVLDVLGTAHALSFVVDAGSRGKVLVVAGGQGDKLTAVSQRNRYLQLLSDILARVAGSQNGVAESSAGGDDQRLREMIHEVSNPITIVRNYLDILSHKLTEQGEEYAELGIIGEELDRTTHILKNFRNPAAAPASSGTVDLNKLVAKLLEVYRSSMLEPRNIQLEVELDSEVAEVAADKTSVQQVIGNLLSNAIEAVEEGGRISIQTMNDVYMDGQAYAGIVLADNGPGIPEEVRKNIFKPVQSTKGNGHAGLGLSIARNLIDKMEGRVAFRTGKQGTEFQIYLPKQRT